MTNSSIPRGIGFLGGTFDPVHTGHLALAREALRAMNLLRVDFLPAPAPWQKDVLTPVNLRVEMLREALAGHDEFGLNLCDVLRPGATYTIDTVRELRDAAGAAMPLVLLIGADQWVNFHTWKMWEKLTDFVSIAICDRGGDIRKPDADVAQWAAQRLVLPREINCFPAGRITTFSMPAHEASSTKIRSLFASEGRQEALKKLTHWLPTATASLIARRNIY